MKCLFVLSVSLCLANAALPPPLPLRTHQQLAQQPHVNDLHQYYHNEAVLKQHSKFHKDQHVENEHLENLDNPDSEVELIPGAQQPQQPPQSPASPNLPGLLPGQRVYIVHMPIPGYRPGTVSGYQPVYIVGASPTNNPNYLPGGYQNAIVLNAAGQAIVSPYYGYQNPGVQAANPGYFLAAPSPYGLLRNFSPLYPEPAYAYQPEPRAPSDHDDSQEPLSQLMRDEVSPPNNPHSVGQEKIDQSSSEKARDGEASQVSKNVSEPPQQNGRIPPHLGTTTRKPYTEKKF